MNTSPTEQLQRLKLKALIADRGAHVAKVTESGLCAALDSDGRAWAVLDGPAGLGAAVAWAARNAASGLHIVAETGADVLTRQAEYFALPVEVSAIEGRTLSSVAAQPLAQPTQPVPAHLAFLDQIAAAGATPNIEHGVVAGEVRGLEVCRVVDDPNTGEARLEVGVGAHDRELFQMMHGTVAAPDALADVVATVSELRADGAAPHPLNGLARERLLSAKVIDRPGLIGASSVLAAQPPTPRQSLKDAVPCVALATIDGHHQAAVFSHGVDLDLLVIAAEARRALGVEQAIVVVPARDALAVQQLISDQLRLPIRIVPLSDEQLSDEQFSDARQDGHR